VLGYSSSGIPEALSSNPVLPKKTKQNKKTLKIPMDTSSMKTDKWQ
jgi:hypothetical protein